MTTFCVSGAIIGAFRRLFKNQMPTQSHSASTLQEKEMQFRESEVFPRSSPWGRAELGADQRRPRFPAVLHRGAGSVHLAVPPWHVRNGCAPSESKLELVWPWSLAADRVILGVRKENTGGSSFCGRPPPRGLAGRA